jgi:DcmR-like sensory protein
MGSIPDGNPFSSASSVFQRFWRVPHPFAGFCERVGFDNPRPVNASSSAHEIRNQHGQWMARQLSTKHGWHPQKNPVSLLRAFRIELGRHHTFDKTPVPGTEDPNVTDEPINFAGSPLGKYRHICAFFHSPDEEYRVLLPFIKEGIEQKQKAFHIVDPKRREDHLGRLRSAGIDTVEAEKTGQLQVKRWEEAYLRQGHFDQDAMLALIEEVLQSGPREGFTLTRLVANMEWALEDRPGVNDLVEYETRLNYVLPKYKDPVI